MPLLGTVKKTSIVPGAYFSESQIYGFLHCDSDAPDSSQGYIPAVSTRTLVIIGADNPNIGLCCFVAVGVAEDVGFYERQHVKRGEELGMFHFGGRT